MKHVEEIDMKCLHVLCIQCYSVLNVEKVLLTSFICLNSFYVLVYNTARFFPHFPLDYLAMYIVHIHGLFIYLHGSRVEPHPIDAFDWL